MILLLLLLLLVDTRATICILCICIRIRINDIDNIERENKKCREKRRGGGNGADPMLNAITKMKNIIIFLHYIFGVM